MIDYVVKADALAWSKTLEPRSIDLLLTDPPYYGIVEDAWDNQWSNEDAYILWLTTVIESFKPALKSNASILIFQGIGKHGSSPILDIRRTLEKEFYFRNWITWKKRRAYGKEYDYLFCREEILWFSMSQERTNVTFNIPLLDEKRGYAGFSEKYPAKSEYKRVSNVWDDIPELMRPERNCQKPLELMDRFIETHSNPGDLVVDPFAGWGSTGVSALRLGRRFLGCEAIEEDAAKANERCIAAASGGVIVKEKKESKKKSSNIIDLDSDD